MNKPTDYTKPHTYEGTLLVCLKCFEPKSSAKHTISHELESRHSLPAMRATGQMNHEAERLPSHVHICPVCETTQTCNQLDCSQAERTICALCAQFGPIEPEPEVEQIIIKPAPADLKPVDQVTCPSHTCPKCDEVWKHDYDCKKDRKHSALCVDCASQSAVLINRPNEIEQLAMTSGSLIPGSEASNIMLDYDNVIYELIHLSGSDPRPLKSDWQELIHKDRYQLKQIIERLKCKMQSNSRMMMKVQTEEVTKLSPEEREQYERDARRAKQKPATSKGEKSSSTPKVIDQKKAYNDMIKNLGAQISAKRPKLSSDEVVRLAEERYKKLQEEEE